MYNQITSNKRKSILLVIIFVLVVFALAYFISLWFGYDYYFIFTLALILSLVMTLSSYYKGDRVALALAGAKGPLVKEHNPYVYRLVENLCITAGLPMPKIYIIPDPAMNAFATGRDPAHSSIALTQGIIDKLENEELEGVIAHELSHIKNYDIRLATLVIVLVGLVSIMANIFLRMNMWGGRRSSGRGGGQAGAILMIIGFVLIILSPIIAQLIKLAVSRKREFLADASGSLLTRYPEGLARALEKIGNENAPMQKVTDATAHLYLASPFGRKKSIASRLFATHPPIEERITALRQMGNAR